MRISVLSSILLVTTISVGSLNFYCQKLNADWDDQNQDLQRLIDDMPKSENGPVWLRQKEVIDRNKHLLRLEEICRQKFVQAQSKYALSNIELEPVEVLDQQSQGPFLGAADPTTRSMNWKINVSKNAQMQLCWATVKANVARQLTTFTIFRDLGHSPQTYVRPFAISLKPGLHDITLSASSSYRELVVDGRKLLYEKTSLSEAGMGLSSSRMSVSRLLRDGGHPLLVGHYREPSGSDCGKYLWLSVDEVDGTEFPGIGTGDQQ